MLMGAIGIPGNQLEGVTKLVGAIGILGELYRNTWKSRGGGHLVGAIGMDCIIFDTS